MLKETKAVALTLCGPFIKWVDPSLPQVRRTPATPSSSSRYHRRRSSGSRDERYRSDVHTEAVQAALAKHKERKMAVPMPSKRRSLVVQTSMDAYTPPEYCIKINNGDAVHCRVYGGPDVSSPRLAQLCTTRPPNQPLQVSSTGNFVTVRFKTDHYISGKGFNASWQEVQGGCGGVFTAPSGEIHSPNYPNPYSVNVDCSWIINVDQGHRVLLTFNDFDIENHDSCGYDYLAVERPQGSTSRSVPKYGNAELMETGDGVPVSSRVSAKIQQLVNTLKRPKRPPLREFFVDDFEELLEEAALQRWGTISPKAPCLTTMDTNGKPLYILTYGKLWTRSMKVAYNILHKLGSKQEPMVRPGDRVALVFPNNDPAAFMVAFYGCLLAEIVPVPIEVPLTRKDAGSQQIGFLLGSCGVTVALTSDACHKGLPKSPTGEIPQFKGNTKKPPYKELPIIQAILCNSLYKTCKDGSVLGVTVTRTALLTHCQALTQACGYTEGSISSCDAFLNVFQSKGLRPEVICPCASSPEALTVAIRKPTDDSNQPPGRGVLSMQGLSYGVIRVDSEEKLSVLTVQDVGTVMPGGLMCVVKPDGVPQICRTDEIGELCVCSIATGTSYYGLSGMTKNTFEVFPMCSSGAPVSEYPFARTGLLGFIGPGGLVFIAGKMDGLMVVSGRRHNADDIVATALAVEPMKFVYRGSNKSILLRMLLGSFKSIPPMFFFASGSISSCDAFLNVFQSKGLRPEVICPCASSPEALTVAIRRPTDDSNQPPGRGVLSMQGLSYGVIRVDSEEKLSVLTVQDVGTVMPGGLMCVVKPDGVPQICRTDEIGELCVCSIATGTSYYGLSGMTKNTFEVFPMCSSGAPVSEYPFARTGLLGFIGPGGLVFIAGKMDGLMVVSGRRHNADDIVATALAVEPMKFVYRGRIAVFSISVLHDERVVIVAEQRPDSTEEDSFQWMSRVLQAIDSIHQVGVYCLALVPANTLPKTPLGGIHLSETKQLFLEGSLHPCNVLMCPHTCVTNLPKPRQKQPEIGPASVMVGNLVSGKRIAQASGRDLGQIEDNDQARKVCVCVCMCVTQALRDLFLREKVEMEFSHAPFPSQSRGLDLSRVRTCVAVAEERPRISLTQSFSKLFKDLGLHPRAVSTSFGCRVNLAICLQGSFGRKGVSSQFATDGIRQMECESQLQFLCFCRSCLGFESSLPILKLRGPWETRTSGSAVFTWTNLLVVVVELDGSEQEALDLVPLVTNVVLEEHYLIVGVVVVVDIGVIPINSRGEKQRMHLRDGFLADQLDPIYVAYNM
ncbi:UNVERIFIED_CONTAM: hypothetical protein FKN15_008151 [Acipenser sinensis]